MSHVACLDDLPLNLSSLSPFLPPPQSCPCDTWARGALPVKQRPKPVEVLQTQKTRRASIMAPGGSTGPRSVANVPVTGGPKSRHGGAASVASFNSRRGKEPGRASAAPAGGEEGEEDYESRLRKELEYRRQQQMAAAQSAARDADERSRLVSIAKELRGKDFAYDHKGEVVVLNKLDPEKLPPADLMLTFKVVVSLGMNNVSLFPYRMERGGSSVTHALLLFRIVQLTISFLIANVVMRIISLLTLLPFFSLYSTPSPQHRTRWRTRRAAGATAAAPSCSPRPP